MRFLDDGQKVENVYHLDGAAPANGADLVDMAILFADWWDVTMQPLVTDVVQLVAVVAKALDTESSPAIEYVTGLPLTGGDTTGSLPNNVTLAVKWLTGLSGRSFRGRTYHIGLSKDQVADNIVVATPLAAIVAAYNTLISDTTSAGRFMAVASSITGGAPRTTGVMTPIVSATADNTIDSQRRRLPGRGQ
jgi:hypothetical protein